MQQDVAETNLSELAKVVSRRKFGIGSDGLLVLEGLFGGARLRMFNPDGSEDFCGNGLRCAGWHIFQETGQTEFHLLHGQVEVPIEIVDHCLVQATLPPAKFDPRDVPLLVSDNSGYLVIQGVKGISVSTGSTHFITFLDSPLSEERFVSLGQAIECDPIFPERTSTMFTQVIEPHVLRIRIWERGAGETLGCGTGSVAAAVAYSKVTGIKGQIIVQNPGGEVLVELENWQSSVRSSTKPRRVFQGILKLDSEKLKVYSEKPSWLLV